MSTKGNSEQAKRNVVIRHSFFKAMLWNILQLQTKKLLQRFQWEVIDQPSYSMDLTPDFHLFPHIKWRTGKQHLGTDNELQASIVN
jgi:hypothetical protein